MIRALILAIGILLPVASNARVESYLPFSPLTDRAFKSHINSLGKQSDGSTYELLDVRKCEARDMQSYQSYNCDSVDYKQTNYMGTRTCVNRKIRFTTYKHNRYSYFVTKDQIVGSPSRCSPYRQVSFNKYQSPTKSTNKNQATDKDIMIGGGFLIFAAGFGMGLAVSGLRKQRADATKSEKSEKEGDKE